MNSRVQHSYKLSTIERKQTRDTQLKACRYDAVLKRCDDSCNTALVVFERTIDLTLETRAKKHILILKLSLGEQAENPNPIASITGKGGSTRPQIWPEDLVHYTVT